MAAEDYSLINNEAENRFQFDINGAIALINYVKRDNVYYLIHTEVPEALQGRGIAGILVDKTLKHLEEGGYKMIPYCPYVQSYLKRHPEWQRLVAGN
jgi:hypothetical protein